LEANRAEFIDYDLPWGTHFSLLYRSKEELLEIIIPYFRAGLEQGELCVLITASLLSEAEALAAMRRAIPGFADYLDKGQMEIISCLDWYLKGGSFEQAKVVELWQRKISQAAAGGYPGLRASGDVSWLTAAQWGSFTEYERVMNEKISNGRLVVLCTYPLSCCGMYEAIDVVRNHQFVVAKKDGGWQVIENSEFRRTEQALRANEVRYRQIVETVREGILLIDAAGIITFANKRMADLLSCPISELTGMPFTQYLADSSPCFLALRGEPVTAWSTVRSDCRFCRTDGSTFLGSVAAAPLPGDSANQPMVITVADVTEQRKMEAEMARLEQLNLVGQIAASIGHEVRNPMTTVRGFLQIMLSSPDHAAEREYLSLMVDELDRTNAIISEFLSLAKDKCSEIREGNLNSVLTAMTPLLTAAAMEKGCDLVIEAGTVPAIHLDEKEIKQMLLNLVRNSIEATPAGGRITVRTGPDGDGVALTVRDNGTGIPPEVLPKVGTPFFTTKADGTGLGVAVCFSIAQRHNAVVDITSDATGTVFTVRFPGLAAVAVQTG